MTALSPMWDKLAGLYLATSRSTNRLSECQLLSLMLLLNMPSDVCRGLYTELLYMAGTHSRAGRTIAPPLFKDHKY